MHSLLIEKTAVVTGATGGIGLEIAKNSPVKERPSSSLM